MSRRRWHAAAVLVILACGEAPPQEPAGKPEPVVLKPEVKELLDELQRDLREERYAEGVRRAREHLDRDPRAPLVHYALANLLGAGGDHRAAAAEFERELERDPDHFGSLRGLAVALSRLGELEASLPYFERCLELRPGAPGMAFQLGRNLSALGRFEAAEDHLRRAAAGAGGAPAWVELGILKRRQGDLEAAAAAFRRALAGDPDHLAALFNLGQTLVQLGDAARGEELLEYHAGLVTRHDRLERFRQASQIVDASAANFILLARAHLDLGHREAAAAAYRRALELEPQNLAAVLGLATVELERGELEEATRRGVLALALDPDRSDTHFLLGLVNLRGGRPEAAEVDFQASRHRGEWSAGMYLRLGDAYRETGDAAAAAIAYDEAARRDPESAGAHFELARTRWMLGEDAAAASALARSLELDSGRGDAWMLAGVLAVAAGDGTTAAQAFRQALGAQRIELLKEGGAAEIVERFAALPGAEPALALYRLLRDETAPRGSWEITAAGRPETDAD